MYVSVCVFVCGCMCVNVYVKISMYEHVRIICVGVSVCGHVYEHVCRDVCGCVYGHVCRGCVSACV